MYGYIKESNHGGVYSRLYLDSTVRKKKQANIEKLSTLTADTSLKSRNRVENTLMLKHAKSQAKISTMRYKQQLKETEGVTAIPKINKISKEIVQLREGGANEPVSLYTTKLLNASRSSSTLKITPKQSFLSLVELKQAGESGKNKRLIKLVEVQEPEEPEYAPREYAAVQALKKPSNKNDEEIQKIRKAVFEKCKAPEPPPEKKSLLSMSVLERNTQWLEKKNLRISQQKEVNLLQETSGCTFSPRLTPRIDISFDTRIKNQSICSSYTEKYLGPAAVPSKPAQRQETSVGRREGQKSLLYKAISPHERNFSQGNSMKLLQNAKVMVSYNHCK